MAQKIMNDNIVKAKNTLPEYCVLLRNYHTYFYSCTLFLAIIVIILIIKSPKIINKR